MRREDAHQCERGHGLAAPALPGQAENLTAADGEAHVVDDRDRLVLLAVLADGDAEVADVEDRAHAASPAAGLTWPYASSVIDRGSRASRSASPMKLKPITTVKMARPAKVASHQSWKFCDPEAIIEPHSAIGGGEATTREETPESSRIALPTPSVASTTTGPSTLRTTSTRSART